MLFLLAGALALGLTACGSNSATTTTAAAYSTSSWADVTVASGDQTVTLTWTDNNNTTNNTSITYNIYWSLSPGVTKKTGNKIANVTSPYIHTGLTDGTNYYYVITAVSSGVEGVASKEVSAAPQAAVPAAPALLSITAGDSSVTITLNHTNEPSNVTYYLYWSTSSDIINNLSNTSIVTKVSGVFTGTGTTDTYTLNNLTDSAQYYFCVTADTGDGEGPPSQVLSAIPTKTQAPVNYSAGPPVQDSQYGTPTPIIATAGNQQVTISWTPPSSPSTTETGASTSLTYTINWWTSTNSTPQTIIYSPPSSSASSPSYSQYFLANGTTYYYNVTAVQNVTTNGTTVQNPGGTTSATVSVVPEAIAPPVPSGLSAAAGNQQVSLSWSNNDTGYTVTYNLYYTTTPTVASSWAEITNIPSNSYVHTGLTTGTTYYYQVTAQINGVSESGKSNVIAVTP